MYASEIGYHLLPLSKYRCVGCALSDKCTQGEICFKFSYYDYYHTIVPVFGIDSETYLKMVRGKVS